MSCCHNQTVTITERHRARIVYEGGRPISVTGAVTGRTYRFSGVERERLVDPRDAIVLLRHPLFGLKSLIELDPSD